MDKLYFTTAGIPLGSQKNTYESGFELLDELGLDGLELEFVRGVRMSEVSRETVLEYSKRKDKVITAHAPFYINLNSKEEEKIINSIKYITDTALTAGSAGAYSITYHAAYYMGDDKDKTYKAVYDANEKIGEFLKENSIDIWVRPETTGKATQWGDLEEIVKLSKEFDFVLPCVDFSHLHARYAGKVNTYDEFAHIFEFIGNELGQNALENFHAHIAGIEYSDKGEKKHLMLKESDFNYKDLMKAFADFKVKGVVVCESPVMEEDAVILKETYNVF